MTRIFLLGVNCILITHRSPLSFSLSLSSPCLVFVSLNRHLSNRIAACNRIPQNINSLCSSLFLSLSLHFRGCFYVRCRVFDGKQSRNCRVPGVTKFREVVSCMFRLNLVIVGNLCSDVPWKFYVEFIKDCGCY